MLIMPSSLAFAIAGTQRQTDAPPYLNIVPAHIQDPTHPASVQYYQQEHVPSTGDDLERLEQECEDAWQKKEELLAALQEARLMSGKLESELGDRLRVRLLISHLYCLAQARSARMLIDVRLITLFSQPTKRRSTSRPSSSIIVHGQNPRQPNRSSPLALERFPPLTQAPTSSRCRLSTPVWAWVFSRSQGLEERQRQRLRWYSGSC
jgi:hypothetical protein